MSCCTDCASSVASKLRNAFSPAEGSDLDVEDMHVHNRSSQRLHATAAHGKQGASTSSGNSAAQVEDAIKSMIDDVLRHEPKIPTFDWRFRRGYGPGTVIGPVGAQRVSRALASVGKDTRAKSAGGDAAAQPPGTSLSSSSSLAASGPLHVSCIEWQSQLVGDVGASALSLVLSAGPGVSFITSLNLSGNGITSTGAFVIAEALKATAASPTSVQLQKLVLYDNPIGSLGVEAVCRALCASVTMRHLEMGSSDGRLLSEAATLSIKDLVAMSPLLAVLKLHGQNTFTCASLAAVLKSLESSKSQLAELSLLNCVDSSLQVLYQLRNLISTIALPLRQKRSTLMTLELRLPLGDSGGLAIAELIKTSANLRSLLLSKCSLGAKGLEAIGLSLQSNRSIAKLDISVQDVALRPSMAEQGIRPLRSVFQSLSINRGLVELIATDIVVQDEDIEEVCAALEHSRNTVIRTIRHAPILSDMFATRLDNLLRDNAERLVKGSRGVHFGPVLHTMQLGDAQRDTVSPTSSLTNSETSGGGHAGGLLSAAGAGAGAAEEYVSFGIPGRSNLAALLAAPKAGEVREDQMVDLVVED